MLFFHALRECFHVLSYYSSIFFIESERSTLNRFAELWLMPIAVAGGAVMTACILIFSVVRLISGKRPKYRRKKRWRR